MYKVRINKVNCAQYLTAFSNTICYYSYTVRMNEDGDPGGFVNISDGENDASSDKEVPDSGLDAISTRKRTSDVWSYFDVVTVNEVKMAKCKGCGNHLSYKGGNGISHLRKHYRISCRMRHLDNTVGQTTLRTKVGQDGCTNLELKEKYKDFRKDLSRNKLVTMIVVHEYPLSMVEHFGFKDFVKSLNPTFKMISRNTLKSDIFKMYNSDKVSLKRLLEYNDSRVAVTTDMWTASNQKKGYMVVTSHFIDANWVLRNRTLR